MKGCVYDEKEMQIVCVAYYSSLSLLTMLESSRWSASVLETSKWLRWRKEVQGYGRLWIGDTVCVTVFQPSGGSGCRFKGRY